MELKRFCFAPNSARVLLTVVKAVSICPMDVDACAAVDTVGVLIIAEAAKSCGIDYRMVCPPLAPIWKSFPM